MLVLAILSLARVTLKEVTSEKLWLFKSFQVLCPLFIIISKAIEFFHWKMANILLTLSLNLFVYALWPDFFKNSSKPKEFNT